jgi:hypothetical protein
MAQWVEALATMPGDPSSYSSCPSQSRASQTKCLPGFWAAEHMEMSGLVDACHSGL